MQLLKPVCYNEIVGEPFMQLWSKYRIESMKLDLLQKFFQGIFASQFWLTIPLDHKP